MNNFSENCKSSDQDRSEQWLSVSIFCPEPWENVLKLLIKPLVEEIILLNKCYQFFFIRYWENGPHIRLRTKLYDQVSKKEIKSIINEKVNNFFLQDSSINIKNFTCLDQQQMRYHSSPVSIQYNQYEPEIDRYGGLYRLSISEKQFEASSKAVLSILSECDNWDYSLAMGYALKLHIGFIFAANMNLKEASSFLSHMANNWIPYLTNDVNKNSNHELENYSRIKIMKAFESSFIRQKPILLNFVKELWIELCNNDELDQQWLKDWVSISKEIDMQIEVSFQEEQAYHLGSKDSTLQKKWSIYYSYIHMTNNRLGILNRDEGYLGYILKLIFEELYASGLI